MFDLELTRSNLENFLNVLRPEDKKELEYFLKENAKDEIINFCLNNKEDTCFLGKDEKTPLILGGIYKIQKDNLKQGQIWLLCSNSALKHKKEVYAYVKNKILSYKKENDYLFNHIYKSNYKALKWLSKLGFKVVDLDNQNYKLFYYKKEKQF